MIDSILLMLYAVKRTSRESTVYTPHFEPFFLFCVHDQAKHHPRNRCIYPYCLAPGVELAAKLVVGENFAFGETLATLAIRPTARNSTETDAISSSV